MKESAHNGQVSAIATCGNCLYSTSNKNLKIWDLDEMKCVSDISAHSGYIKCLKVWDKHSYLLTASDKTVMVWDLISLTNVFTFKYHKDEIRAVEVSSCGKYMISAGKGSADQGAMCVWDLRSQKEPLAELEKNEDIFSLEKYGDIIYAGSRSAQIIPIDLATQKSIPRISPPHGDVVTSLRFLGDTLVSGSRDKGLRFWNPSTLAPKYPEALNAHGDWINSLESDHEGKYLFSGGKEGVVKVWNAKQNKMVCTAALSCSGSVNSICKLDAQFGKTIACGTSDKTIKMWRLKDKYMDEGEEDQAR